MPIVHQVVVQCILLLVMHVVDLHSLKCLVLSNFKNVISTACIKSSISFLPALPG